MSSTLFKELEFIGYDPICIREVIKIHKDFESALAELNSNRSVQIEAELVTQGIPKTQAKKLAEKFATTEEAIKYFNNYEQEAEKIKKTLQEMGYPEAEIIRLIENFTSFDDAVNMITKTIVTIRKPPPNRSNFIGYNTSIQGPPVLNNRIVSGHYNERPDLHEFRNTNPLNNPSTISSNHPPIPFVANFNNYSNVPNYQENRPNRIQFPLFSPLSTNNNPSFPNQINPSIPRFPPLEASINTNNFINPSNAPLPVPLPVPLPIAKNSEISRINPINPINPKNPQNIPPPRMNNLELLQNPLSNSRNTNNSILPFSPFINPEISQSSIIINRDINNSIRPPLPNNLGNPELFNNLNPTINTNNSYRPSINNSEIRIELPNVPSIPRQLVLNRNNLGDSFEQAYESITINQSRRSLSSRGMRTLTINSNVRPLPIIQEPVVDNPEAIEEEKVLENDEDNNFEFINQLFGRLFLLDYLAELYGKKGLDQEQISKIPKVFYHSQKNFITDTCTICYEEFINDEEAMMLPCNHPFHTDCISTWFKASVVCPLCKFDMTDD